MALKKIIFVALGIFLVSQILGGLAYCAAEIPALQVKTRRKRPAFNR